MTVHGLPERVRVAQSPFGMLHFPQSYNAVRSTGVRRSMTSDPAGGA